MKLSIKEVMYIVGLLLFAAVYLIYPRIQQWAFDNRTQNAIVAFETRIESYRDYRHRQILSHGGDIIAPEYDRASWLYNVWTFVSFKNQVIYVQGQEHLRDPFYYNHPSFNMQPFLGFDSYIIGVLTIPVIDLALPIYMGASIENLHRGAAQLLHSSFPVGGNSTNAVIAGYRNVNQIFRDIPLLDIGDEIHIANFHQTLTYAVVDIQVTDVGDTDALMKQSDRDLVTLITQYGRRGDRRYLVIAERTVLHEY